MLAFQHYLAAHMRNSRLLDFAANSTNFKVMAHMPPSQHHAVCNSTRHAHNFSVHCVRVYTLSSWTGPCCGLMRPDCTWPQLHHHKVIDDKRRFVSDSALMNTHPCQHHAVCSSMIHPHNYPIRCGKVYKPSFAIGPYCGLMHPDCTWPRHRHRKVSDHKRRPT